MFKNRQIRKSIAISVENRQKQFQQRIDETSLNRSYKSEIHPLYKIGDIVTIIDTGKLYQNNYVAFNELNFINKVFNTCNNNDKGMIFYITKSDDYYVFAINLSNGGQCLIREDGITKRLYLKEKE